MNLSSVFSNVVHKQLVAVDLPNVASNQHELNGVNALREFFGTSDTKRGSLSWHYFADDQEPVNENGEFTFYDARAKSSQATRRSEWRFYYYGTFLIRADIGDWFFLALSKSGHLYGLVFQNNSAWLRAAQILFGAQTTTPKFGAIGREAMEKQQLELVLFEAAERHHPHS